ncbi:MAG: PepSY domain-containing protein, partial [Flavobacteriia bacterium]|nr:PepSY domain-containing protein [Flavobacteriia bacterium]
NSTGIFKRLFLDFCFCKISGSILFSKFENVIYSLHYANYGGIFVKIIYSILALLSGLMPITGFILWRRRTKKQK